MITRWEQALAWVQYCKNLRESLPEYVIEDRIAKLEMLDQVEKRALHQLWSFFP